MSDGKVIGKISVKDANEVEWTITHIFAYTEVDHPYISPYFTVSGTEWYLQVYPNGETQEDSAGWISLYLFRRFDKGPAQGVLFSFGVKKSDKSVKEILNDSSWLFDKDGAGFGKSKFLLRSEVLEQKSELEPLGELTVTCTLWVKEIVESPTSFSYNFLQITGLLSSKKYSDVTLKVKNEEFPAHKTILAARSSVFADMFDADSGEEIVIEDCEPGVFKDFLTYLYSGRFETLSSSPFDLYVIANKFSVKDLMSDCLISIMRNLSVENFCESAVLGKKFDIDALRIKCEDFFLENFTEIVPSEKWDALLEGDTAVAGDLIRYKAIRELELKKAIANKRSGTKR